MKNPTLCFWVLGEFDQQIRLDNEWDGLNSEHLCTIHDVTFVPRIGEKLRFLRGGKYRQFTVENIEWCIKQNPEVSSVAVGVLLREIKENGSDQK